MFDDLSFGEPQGVAPKKMERKVETLPQPIADAYDKTPLGEARIFPVTVPEGKDPKRIGTRLLSLLKKHAASTDTVAFKASFTVQKGGGLTLYWQRKAARKPTTASLEPPTKPRNRTPKGGGAV